MPAAKERRKPTATSTPAASSQRASSKPTATSTPAASSQRASGQRPPSKPAALSQRASSKRASGQRASSKPAASGQRASSKRASSKRASSQPAASRQRSSRPPTASRKPASAEAAARGKLLVFVGPSLPSAEAQRLLPRAEVRPPIAVGELLALALGPKPPACVVILDGYFERMAAVWHKEILVALERGVAVWGGASMGALRAAELAPWGMIGVGEIYEAFARGELEADDEVAVAHLPAEHDHRPISDALVNLRDGLARAAAAAVLPRRAAAALVERARLLPYRERSWRQLLVEAEKLRLPAATIAKLARWLERTRPDRKGDDARRLLTQLARHGFTRPAPIEVPRTWALRQLERLVR